MGSASASALPCGNNTTQMPKTDAQWWAHSSIPSISTKETIMSLVRYVFVCMVYCACSVVATTITVVDAVVRCCTVLYEGHIRLFIQLYYPDRAERHPNISQETKIRQLGRTSPCTDETPSNSASQGVLKIHGVTCTSSLSGVHDRAKTLWDHTQGS